MLSAERGAWPDPGTPPRALIGMSQSARDIEDAILAAFEVSKPLPATEIAVSDQFRDHQNHPGGVRAPDALKAFALAPRVDRWTTADGSSVSLAVTPKTATQPYRALVVAVEEVPAGCAISQAWRLYGDDWPESPTNAFAEFVSRFGLDVVVGTQPPTRFIASLTIGGEAELRVAADPAPPHSISALVSQADKTFTRIAWAYAINDEAYRHYVVTSR